MITYEEALAEAKTRGLSQCSDAAAMAAFCAGSLQLILGAVGPRLTFEGAQREGLTYKELVTLCIREPAKAEELQWGPS